MAGMMMHPWTTAQNLCARQAWLEGKGEQDVTLKFETGAQRVQIPSRQRLASRREASLVRRGVTPAVKRRQRARGPRDGASKGRVSWEPTV